jgi:energy-converting hydrogenase Eha subunit E
MSKKEKAIKDINVKELKANFRTIAIVLVFVSFAAGLILGYFASISIITDSQAKAIEVVQSVKQ